MQLRHIRPRSVEWYDALEWDQRRGSESLSPEEALRLRHLVAMEEAGDLGAPPGQDEAPPLLRAS
jgi:hypothetical protein